LIDYKRFRCPGETYTELVYGQAVYNTSFQPSYVNGYATTHLTLNIEIIGQLTSQVGSLNF